MSAAPILGSARASRAGDGDLAIANFSYLHRSTSRASLKVRYGEAPQPAREARALPGNLASIWRTLTP